MNQFLVFAVFSRHHIYVLNPSMLAFRQDDRTKPVMASTANIFARCAGCISRSLFEKDGS